MSNILLTRVSKGEEKRLPCWKKKKVEETMAENFANLAKDKNLYFKKLAVSLQSCPTLCDPIGGSPPGSPVPGILQARTLEWVAISFSNAWNWKVKVKSLSRVQLLATPWTAACQAPPFMGFSRQEYQEVIKSFKKLRKSQTGEIHI